jgi:FimV-like protein
MNTFKSGTLVKVACAVLALAAWTPGWGQMPSGTYEVRKGDTLSEIARKTKHDGVNRNQMILGIHRANPEVFAGGNINLLRAGQVLRIPGREEVAVLDPAAGAAPAPGREEAARRYRQGLALERRGDERGALKAFLDAGEGGHGLAQRKLGEIYDKGDSAAERDYETSLKWYQKAREQGVAIPNPIVRSPR